MQQLSTTIPVPFVSTCRRAWLSLRQHHIDAAVLGVACWQESFKQTTTDRHQQALEDECGVNPGKPCFLARPEALPEWKALTTEPGVAALWRLHNFSVPTCSSLWGKQG